MRGGPRPGAGRPKGSIDKDSKNVALLLQRLNCNPFEGMAIIALNKLPCGVCRGKGKTPYAIPTGLGEPPKVAYRKCESCYGTLYEACSPELRGKMYAELATYLAPKLKQTDHTSSDGSNRPVWVVNVAPVVQQPQVTESKAHPRVLDVAPDKDVQ